MNIIDNFLPTKLWNKITFPEWAKIQQPFLPGKTPDPASGAGTEGKVREEGEVKEG